MLVSDSVLKTFQLPDFDPDTYNKDVPVASSRPFTVPAATAYRRLSPFQAPQGVGIEVLHNNIIRIKFAYPNEEPPKPKPRKFQEIPNWEFSVGKFTHKILSIQICSAAESIAARQLCFDLDVVRELASELPAVRRAECERNIEIVAAIMCSVPPQLTNRMQEFLRVQARRSK